MIYMSFFSENKNSVILQLLYSILIDIFYELFMLWRSPARVKK